jgi:hypothetical protein
MKKRLSLFGLIIFFVVSGFLAGSWFAPIQQYVANATSPSGNSGDIASYSIRNLPGREFNCGDDIPHDRPQFGVNDTTSVFAIFRRVSNRDVLKAVGPADRITSGYTDLVLTQGSHQFDEAGTYIYRFFNSFSAGFENGVSYHSHVVNVETSHWTMDLPSNSIDMMPTVTMSVSTGATIPAGQNSTLFPIFFPFPDKLVDTNGNNILDFEEKDNKQAAVEAYYTKLVAADAVRTLFNTASAPTNAGLTGDGLKDAFIPWAVAGDSDVVNNALRNLIHDDITITAYGNASYEVIHEAAGARDFTTTPRRTNRMFQPRIEGRSYYAVYEYKHFSTGTTASFRTQNILSERPSTGSTHVNTNNEATIMDNMLFNPVPSMSATLGSLRIGQEITLPQPTVSIHNDSDIRFENQTTVSSFTFVTVEYRRNSNNQFRYIGIDGKVITHFNGDALGTRRNSAVVGLENYDKIMRITDFKFTPQEVGDYQFTYYTVTHFGTGKSQTGVETATIGNATTLRDFITGRDALAGRTSTRYIRYYPFNNPTIERDSVSPDLRFTANFNVTEDASGNEVFMQGAHYLYHIVPATIASYGDTARQNELGGVFHAIDNPTGLRPATPEEMSDPRNRLSAEDKAFYTAAHHMPATSRNFISSISQEWYYRLGPANDSRPALDAVGSGAGSTPSRTELFGSPFRPGRNPLFHREYYTRTVSDTTTRVLARTTANAEIVGEAIKFEDTPDFRNVLPSNSNSMRTRIELGQPLVVPAVLGQDNATSSEGLDYQLYLYRYNGSVHADSPIYWSSGRHGASTPHNGHIWNHREQFVLYFDVLAFARAGDILLSTEFDNYDVAAGRVTLMTGDGANGRGIATANGLLSNFRGEEITGTYDIMIRAYDDDLNPNTSGAFFFTFDVVDAPRTSGRISNEIASQPTIQGLFSLGQREYFENDTVRFSTVVADDLRTDGRNLDVRYYASICKDGSDINPRAGTGAPEITEFIGNSGSFKLSEDDEVGNYVLDAIASDGFREFYIFVVVRNFFAITNDIQLLDTVPANLMPTGFPGVVDNSVQLTAQNTRAVTGTTVPANFIFVTSAPAVIFSSDYADAADIRTVSLRYNRENRGWESENNGSVILTQEEIDAEIDHDDGLDPQDDILYEEKFLEPRSWYDQFTPGSLVSQDRPIFIPAFSITYPAACCNDPGSAECLDEDDGCHTGCCSDWNPVTKECDDDCGFAPNRNAMVTGTSVLTTVTYEIRKPSGSVINSTMSIDGTETGGGWQGLVVAGEETVIGRGLSNSDPRRFFRSSEVGAHTVTVRVTNAGGNVSVFVGQIFVRGSTHMAARLVGGSGNSMRIGQTMSLPTVEVTVSGVQYTSRGLVGQQSIIEDSQGREVGRYTITFGGVNNSTTNMVGNDFVPTSVDTFTFTYHVVVDFRDSKTGATHPESPLLDGQVITRSPTHTVRVNPLDENDIVIDIFGNEYRGLATAHGGRYRPNVFTEMTLANSAGQTLEMTEGQLRSGLNVFIPSGINLSSDAGRAFIPDELQYGRILLPNYSINVENTVAGIRSNFLSQVESSVTVTYTRAHETQTLLDTDDDKNTHVGRFTSTGFESLSSVDSLGNSLGYFYFTPVGRVRPHASGTAGFKTVEYMTNTYFVGPAGERLIRLDGEGGVIASTRLRDGWQELLQPLGLDDEEWTPEPVTTSSRVDGEYRITYTVNFNDTKKSLTYTIAMGDVNRPSIRFHDNREAELFDITRRVGQTFSFSTADLNIGEVYNHEYFARPGNLIIRVLTPSTRRPLEPNTNEPELHHHYEINPDSQNPGYYVHSFRLMDVGEYVVVFEVRSPSGVTNIREKEVSVEARYVSPSITPEEVWGTILIILSVGLLLGLVFYFIKTGSVTKFQSVRAKGKKDETSAKPDVV